MEATAEVPAVGVLLCDQIVNLKTGADNVVYKAWRAMVVLKSHVQSSNGPRTALGRYSHQPASDAYLIPGMGMGNDRDKKCFLSWRFELARPILPGGSCALLW